MPGRVTGEAVDGIILLDKPSGMTSNRALQKVKRLIRAKKGGHTGSLDPAATGMLPLCFGEATKVSAFLLDADKSYRVTARLGEKTDTGDADGQVIGRAAVPELDTEAWRSLLEGFVGEIEQTPPMYSALKVNGQRLYTLARQGRTVERKPRSVRIHAITLLEARGDRLVLRVRCSKGTYIRTLVEDIAAAAGTVAHTSALHREAVADLPAASMLTLSEVEQLADGGAEGLRERLMPADRALARWPAVRLPGEAARRFVGGQPVSAEARVPAAPGPVRVYAEADGFLGVGERSAEGVVAPRRIFRTG